MNLYTLTIQIYTNFKPLIRRMVRKESGKLFVKHIRILENAISRLNGLECVVRDVGSGPEAYCILMKMSSPRAFTLVLQAYKMSLSEIASFLPKDTCLVFQSNVNYPGLDKTWKKSIIYEKVI